MMIPWRLNFAGVRDFLPQSIDLSGEYDHIGILGPNGVGKSTISFCMGAVLQSGKVDIGGLRSANLPDDALWKASILFLFKNDGKVKVDAPQYVQFELHIEQTSYQTFAKEYRIAEGDEVDEWDSVTVYKAGDKTNSFSTYKRLLQMKYHLDPDYYYLIWYQNEVNQFSEMAPEERFRVFSEMHGIDKIQKNWETSRELVQEALLNLEDAKRQQDNRKFLLSIQKKKLDQYVDNQKRLTKGFVQYYQALSVLIQITQHEIERHEEAEEHLRLQLDETNEQLQTLESNREQFRLQLQEKQIQRSQLKELVNELDQKQSQLKQQYQDCKKQHDQLDEELVAIRKEISSLPAEPFVDEQLELGKHELTRLGPLIAQEENELQTIELKLSTSKREEMELSYERKKDNEREKEAKHVLSLYGSRHQVESSIQDLDTAIVSEKDQLKRLQETQTSYQKEELELQQNEVNSPRQKQAKQFFSRQGIQAYALRDLLQLGAQAKLSDEEKYDALKYTMFVNNRTFSAPNDLYYVALPAIVPNEYLTRLSDYHLAIRDDLATALEPLAIKALWWVKSFFEESSAVTIVNGYLVDEKGMRGPQEQSQYILSATAVKQRKATLKQLIEQGEQSIQAVKSSLLDKEKQVKNLRDLISNVEQAEAFMADEKNRHLRQQRIEELQKQIEKCTHLKQIHTQQLDDLKVKQSKGIAKNDMYFAFKKKWLEFAQEKEKIVQLQQLSENLHELERKMNQQKNILSIRNNEYDACQEECYKYGKKIDQVKVEEEDCAKEITNLRKQITNKENEKETEQRNYFQFNEEFLNLERTAPSFVQEGKEKMMIQEQWLVYEARQKREEGQTTFMMALNEKGIDINAPENYQKMKEEYDRTSEEVNESQSLLLQHQERMEKLRDDLDSTIEGKVLLINQYFVSYMSDFGFEGKIDWDLHEGKKGTMHYYLYLRAKKYGHKMSMTDVSVKARGGRHGIGLSGGEKSLVSLLYALALLQTIQTNPSFIVLDEFDSALDEGRKVKVFDLYVKELGRKMIILTPKNHDTEYMNRFSKAYVIYHRPDIPQSGVMGIEKKETVKD